MGSYYTTVKAINKSGDPVKAEVSCGGTYRGFTDEKTGELSFDLYAKDIYNVSIKSSIYGNASGSVRGGGEAVFRLK